MPANVPHRSSNPSTDSPFKFSRRHLLRAGGLGFLGLNLATLLEAEALAATSGTAGTAGALPPQIKSCIVMFYYGGPSHHDTFDMKPNAPAEVRGTFNSIATNVPGMRVCEHLPHTAKVMQHLTVIRSMHHTMRNHNSAAVEALCGRTPLKGDLELLSNDPTSDFPCYGSALTFLKGRTEQVPAHVALPHVMYNVVKLPGQTAGFLGPAYEPLQVESDPNTPDFRVGAIELPAGLTLGEMENRKALLSHVNARLAGEPTKAQGAMNTFYERAFSLLRSDTVRRAFDINQENAQTRERYGRNVHGQSALLARRLVESGVRFVSVHDRVRNGPNNWDTHDNNFNRLKDDLLPPCDLAFSALVEDLHQRGLLDSTLVVMMGEFGRTPKLSSAGGRDHWPDCYSVVMAGGGVRGGTYFGSSDKLGAYPETDGVTPGDLAATIYARFGLNPKTELHDMTGRPFALAAGEPVSGLFG
jgi:hypothetical protein